MVLVEPADAESPTISTSHILSTIDEHAFSTALILLPGIQYYTGQYFDIKKITAHAHSHGLIIGWDLAHAVGNVDVQLHDWDADFATWCSYKYVNAGPGAIAGLFIHERHGTVDAVAIRDNKQGFRPRLSGWWGGNRATKFEMGSRKSSSDKSGLFSANLWLFPIPLLIPPDSLQTSYQFPAQLAFSLATPRPWLSQRFLHLWRSLLSPPCLPSAPNLLP